MNFLLLDSVFSNEFTGSKTSKPNPTIQRISFYSLYQHLLNTRDEKNVQLEEQLKEKEKKLVF